MPEPEEPGEPDMPEPDEPDEPDIPDEPDDPGDPDLLDEPPLLDEPEDALRSLCPLMPERFVSPASSSEGERRLLDALRELPSSMDSSPRGIPCDEEPDCPCRPDEPDCWCWSPCEPDRPDDPLIPPWLPPWFTFDEPEFLSRSVIWRTSFY